MRDSSGMEKETLETHGRKGHGGGSSSWRRHKVLHEECVEEEHISVAFEVRVGEKTDEVTE